MTEVYDAALRLLDRQVVDADGTLVCNVDDLELDRRVDGKLVVTALLVGPGALGPRLPGVLSRVVVSVWRRLRPDVDPRPGRIPIALVDRVDSAVRLSVPVGELPVLGISGFEEWARQQIVVKLPGAGHAPE